MKAQTLVRSENMKEQTVMIIDEMIKQYEQLVHEIKFEHENHICYRTDNDIFNEFNNRFTKSTGHLSGRDAKILLQYKVIGERDYRQITRAYKKLQNKYDEVLEILG